MAALAVGSEGDPKDAAALNETAMAATRDPAAAVEPGESCASFHAGDRAAPSDSSRPSTRRDAIGVAVIASRLPAAAVPQNRDEQSGFRTHWIAMHSGLVAGPALGYLAGHRVVDAWPGLLLLPVS